MQVTHKPDYLAESDELISSYSVAILSCVLFGLGIGSTFQINGGLLALVAGSLGFLYHIASEHRKKTLYIQQAKVVRERSERRLDAQLSSATMDIVEHVA